MDEQYCAHCGSRPAGPTCCWYVDEKEEPHPHPLVAGRSWTAWTERQRFLITLLMERFGGAAEEWELLCRLPWPERWLLDCAAEPWAGWREPALRFPCLKEKDARGTRYFLTDMARDAYQAHLHDAATVAGHSELLGTW